MARGKLILICQSGGEFVTKDDGSMSYTGGEAHAVDIYPETQCDNLKIKLAEMCNLEYKSLSIKYFLPGNRRTLITLSNDKDLKRMYEFHGNSVTADVFVMGKTSFDVEALNTHRRACGIKLAESVTPIAASTTSAAFHATASPVAIHSTTAPSDANPTVGPAAANAIPVAPVPLSVSKQAGSVISVEARAQSPSGVTHSTNISRAYVSTDDSGAARSIPPNSISVTADASVHSLDVVDMNSTPADTVKKRRRTAAWKIGANGPTIVAVTDNDGDRRKTTVTNNVGDKRKTTVTDNVGDRRKTTVTENVGEKRKEKRKTKSRKKNNLNHNTAAATDDVDQEQDTVPCKDSTSNDSMQAILAQSNDVPPEELVTLWKDGITGVGQEFKSVHEFRDALQKYAIAHRFMYRLKKNDTNRASGRCIAESCSWKIHASWDSSVQKFRIKNMNKVHSCEGESWKSYHPKKNWLVGIIKERLLDSPHHKPKEIANGILRDFGIALNYTQVWRGIADAREQLLGSYKESYNQLPWFCEKMAEANPGSNIKLFTGADERFQRLFVCFHASVHGFQNGCRPIIFLDATSLKSKNHETFLAATALDGDDGVFPVAFAIVDTENDDNWHWFLEQLRSAVSTSQSLTFVSDREKGLKKSVFEVFGNAHHGYSIHHLLESFKKNLKGPFHGDGKGSLSISFIAAAHAVRLDGFRTCTDQIRRVSSQAYDWVQHIEPECWTNALFKGEPYNHVTSNVAQTYTNWIEEVRELPIVRKLEMLSCKLMELINTRRTDSSRWSTKLTPSKEGKLQEVTLRAHGLKVLFSSDTLFEVHNDSINVVDINKRDCSCLDWKETGLPCSHAIAVFNCTGRNVYDYCSRYYKVDNFHLTYSESINSALEPFKPLDSDKTELEAVHVLPPCISKPRSQDKKEETKAKGMARREVSCTRCKETGHNKATCKAAS